MSVNVGHVYEHARKDRKRAADPAELESHRQFVSRLTWALGTKLGLLEAR